MDDGRQRHGQTFFDTLDARVLLIAAVGAAFCFSFVRGPVPSLLCLVFALTLLVLRRPPAALLRHLALANVFVLFLWLTVPATMPGKTVAAIGPVTLSREGVRLALLVTIKSNAILVAWIALAGGMSLSVFGCALDRLRVPPKLVFLFLFACRHIHVIGEEWERLQTAAKLRAFVPRTSVHTYRTVAHMLGLTFINGIDRARRVHEAMLLRGFDGTFRTVMDMKSARRDYVFAILFFSVLVCLLLLDALA